MKVLIVGAGVIGSVYGAHLAVQADTVAVLEHGERTTEIARNGLLARDAMDGRLLQSRVTVVPDPRADVYDIVLVALRRDQLATALGELHVLAGQPALVLFGNNPSGSFCRS